MLLNLLFLNFQMWLAEIILLLLPQQLASYMNVKAGKNQFFCTLIMIAVLDFGILEQLGP